MKPANGAPPARLTTALLSLSRTKRILIIAFFALATTTLAFPLVDNIYWFNFFTPETNVLASVFSVMLGGLMYIIGWYLLVGTIGQTPPARTAILWYFLLGALIVLGVGLLILQGIIIINAPV